ncbi:hypothetical protein ACWF94_19350 [Streptomyces sp. NPDC055078]
MTPQESTQVALELERLRGDFAGFGRDLGDIKTACAVLVERSTRTEQDLRDLRAEKDQELRDLRAETSQEIAEVRADVEEWKKTRWPLQAVGALTGVAGVATGLIALLR